MNRLLLLLGLLALAFAAQAERRLSFQLERQLPVLEARIDGRPARLLLDLGGAAALALRPDWPGGASGELPVEAAGSDLGRLPAQVWKRARIPEGIDGYLGYGFLIRHGLVIDYRAGELRLLAPGEALAACAPAPTVELLQLGSLPYLRFEKAGSSLLLGLDTGANQNVIKQESLHAGAGGVFSLEGLSLGGRPVQPGPFRAIALSLPRLEGLLGHGFFAAHRVCIEPSVRQLAAQAFTSQ